MTSSFSGVTNIATSKLVLLDSSGHNGPTLGCRMDHAVSLDSPLSGEKGAFRFFNLERGNCYKASQHAWVLSKHCLIHILETSI